VDKIEEEGETVKHDYMYIYIYIYKLGGGILKKNQHIRLLVHGHSSLSTFGLHLVRVPEALKLAFFQKCDHKV
jgi:hypothetical protein